MSRKRMTTLLIFIYELCPLIHIFTSFSEHNFATVGNILMLLGTIIEQVRGSVMYKNDNSTYLFLNYVP